MAKNITALKNLYKQLGGDPEDVQDCSTITEVLNAISGKYDGETDAATNPDAIDNIAAVAENIGGGVEKMTLVSKQKFTCSRWGEADITHENLGDDLTRYDGTNAKVIFDGNKYVMPVKYLDEGGEHIQIGEKENDTWVFDNYPVGVELFASGGYAYTADRVEHEIEIISDLPAPTPVSGDTYFPVTINNNTGTSVNSAYLNSKGHYTKGTGVLEVYAPLNVVGAINFALITLEFFRNITLNATVSISDGKNASVIVGTRTTADGQQMQAVIGLTTDPLEATSKITITLTSG